MKASATLRTSFRLCALIALGVGLLFAPEGTAQATATGTVVAWGCEGATDWGQCNVPGGLSGVTAVAGGLAHSLALKGDGSVTAWGCGAFDLGQCSVPSGLSGVTAIAAGNYSSLALKADGTVVAWGCGTADATGACSVPSSLSGVTAIAAGDFHSLALKRDGTVVAWGCGYSDWGQCSVPSGLSGVTAIAAGYYSGLALKADGTVVAWGCGPGHNFGQCTVPGGLSGVTAIAAGADHSVALKGDGTVVAWGFGTPPDALAGVTAVAAGDDQSLALKDDGTVAAWGCVLHDWGQCSLPSGLADVSAIGAGVNHSLAVVGRTTPGIPTGVWATAAPGQATVNWMAPGFNGGSPITGYEVTRYVGGVVQETTSVGVVNHLTTTGLTNGTTYAFAVAARNALGTGPQSAESNAVTPGAPKVTLTVAISGTGNGTAISTIGGIDCGATCTADFDLGTTVMLTASAAAGSTFAGWTGDCSGTGACTLTMDQNRSATAVFTLSPKTLTVTKAGNGVGGISIVYPGGGYDCVSTCARDFASGTQVMLTATAAAGSTFTGWTGDCSGTGTCALTMDKNHLATALFMLLPGTPKTLAVGRAGSGAGSVAMVYAGGLTDCFSACTRDFANGTQVKLAATAAAGSTFTGWTGDCAGTGGCTLTMDQNHSTTATFTLVAAPPTPKTLTLAKAGTGSGTITSSPAGIDCGSTCTRDFAHGTQVTLTATAAAGSTFAGWSDACSGSGACTVAMDAAKTATATFNQVQSPPKTVLCVVPRVKGRPLATAKARIAAAHCRTGKVTKVKSKTVPKGKVISQRPNAGTKLASGSKVNLVVSRGKR